MTKLPVLDLVVLVVYLAGVVAMGLWCGRQNRTSRDFMAAGGKIPGWAVGISIFGTYVSSISFLALPGKAYGGNWNAYTFSLSIPIAAWIAVKWFVPFYRRSGEVSAYEHLEHRFGPWARTYAVICYLLTQLARMGTIMYLLALALSPLLGLSPRVEGEIPWDLAIIILITGIVVIVYTLIGGMAAVIWTDVMQSILLIGGALLCTVLPLFSMPEGPGNLFAIASEHDKFSLGSFGASLAEPTFWVVLGYGLVINLQNFGIDQSYVQRYATAKSDRAAANSVWLGGLLYLPISAVFFFIGTALFANYTARPELLPDGTKADAVFPYYIATALPAGVSGLVVAAVFAAAQSTISSSMNCSATLFLCDLYRRYWRPQASENEAMRVLRVATVVAGLLGTGAALAMLSVKSALDAWWKLSGIFGGGMLGLFLLGRVTRTGSRAALTGTVLGVLVIAWMTLSPRSETSPEWWRSPFHEFLIVVFGTAAILLIGFAAGAVFKQRRLK